MKNNFIQFTQVFFMKYCTLLLAFILLFVLDSEARPFRVEQIPNGDKHQCLNCHLSMIGGARNQFGQEVFNHLTVQNENGNVKWSPQLAALDSDGDGFTNGQELLDPNGTWKIGNNNPGNPDDVGNPCNKNIVPVGVRDLFRKTDNGMISIKNISPNPSVDVINLTFELKEDNYVSIEIFDITGKQVIALDTRFYQSDVHSIIINPASYNLNLSGGSYLLSISTQNSSDFEILKIQK